MRSLVLALVMLASPALAETCVIIVPTDQTPGHASPQIAQMHEMTHCKGWEDDGSIIPPAYWQNKPWPKGMKLERYAMPTKQSTAVCRAFGGDSYACQFFPNIGDGSPSERREFVRSIQKQAQ